jgi:hypothetical protein
MLSADQVPVKTPHSRMQWHKWVVLIAGSTGSALRAVRPPNLHITPDVGAISLDLQRGRIIVALASSHHRPRHAGQLVGKRDRGDLGVSPCQQCGEPGPMLRTMDLGIADHGECAGHEQAPQIAVTLFADTAELIPTSTRVLLGYSRPRSFVNAVQLKPWLRLGGASFAPHGRRFLSIARRNDRGGLNHEDHASFGRARAVHHSFWNDEALTRQ